MSSSATSIIQHDLLAEVDRIRQEVSRGLAPARRSELGQFFTPAATARLMASMALSDRESLRLLDPGAGVGILTAAWVAEICTRAKRPRDVTLTAFELDADLLPILRNTLEGCQLTCQQAGIECRIEVQGRDFIEAGVSALDGSLFAGERPSFDLAILNPPYRKIRSDSRTRQLLRRLGVETSNLYTAFLSLVVSLLVKDGEMIAITPRSFCNGPYFRPFRQRLLNSVSLTRLHVFEARDHTFREDEVLQENVIIHARKGVPQQEAVLVSQSRNAEATESTSRLVPFDRVVQTGDPESFIHLVPDSDGHVLAEAMRALPCRLDDIRVSVSTGRVVEFRAREWLRAEPETDTVPLIYPTHFADGYVAWPKPGSRKPDAIIHEEGSASLLVPNGIYVLVKRFSSKEELRRVVAVIFDPQHVPGEMVGFENHLNYFHADGSPMTRRLAVGLAAFLNSTHVDQYFRQFNGHTQVNATDLRTLRYPSRLSLESLGESVEDEFPDQATLDSLVDEIVYGGAA